jgi:hypothetical protein
MLPPWGSIETAKSRSSSHSKKYAWTVPVSVCRANAITAKHELLLSVAGHPERQSGSCVSALPLGAITLRDWAEGTLSLSRGERDNLLKLVSRRMKSERSLR